ncbi:MAG: low specificity L-threonine aldolase [Ruminococcaceae bacterium]|nr:low specificity L-threonine aldolase [Oscillospiraceae bacterium]
MLSFESDYITGAHPKVLEALCRTNAIPATGYGWDAFSQSAREKIRQACEMPDADVAFLTGGTQTNSTVIAAMLHGTEGVISADSGHIAAHEAGAVEYTGHKVLTVPGTDGKIAAETLDACLSAFWADENSAHMVCPGMVYISHPTEYGTIYSKAELTALREVCTKWNLPLFMDGARLGYALASEASDLTLADIARLCDVFYIGGTKLGALCGEAVVFAPGKMPRNFFGITKQHGALLAKGRLTGVQFDALFTDGLYMEIAREANEKSKRIRDILTSHGIPMAMESHTNQQFPIFTDGQFEALREHVCMSFWEKPDAGHTVARFAACWSTTDADLAELDALLGNMIAVER